MSMFASEDMARIEAQIAAAEERTAAEIMLVTVPQSGAYREVRLTFAFAIGWLVAGIVHAVDPGLGTNWILLVQMLGTALAWPLSGRPFLLRHMLPEQREKRAVERAAELEFLEQGVFDTRDRNGVLILISELEHRVALLGDRGLHQKLEHAGFAELVDHLTRKIREGKATEGACEVIERLGKVLAEMSPPREDNPNELDNRVRQGRVPT
jgi:putative membrane protein